MSAINLGAAGVSWTTVLVGVLNLLVGGAIVAFIKSRPALRKIDADREANLLSERAKEMQEMREQIGELGARLEVALEELRVVRHDLANANQSLDLFIALIEANPERAAEHAAKVKKSREQAQERLAVEKEAVLSTRLAMIRNRH